MHQGVLAVPHGRDHKLQNVHAVAGMGSIYIITHTDTIAVSFSILRYTDHPFPKSLTILSRNASSLALQGCNSIWS